MILSNKLPIRTSQHGFTLVELVMVIVLIGVLSVGAQSLFSSKDAYVDYVACCFLLSSKSARNDSFGDI